MQVGWWWMVTWSYPKCAIETTRSHSAYPQHSGEGVCMYQSWSISSRRAAICRLVMVVGKPSYWVGGGGRCRTSLRRWLTAQRMGVMLAVKQMNQSNHGPSPQEDTPGSFPSECILARCRHFQASNLPWKVHWRSPYIAS